MGRFLTFWEYYSQISGLPVAQQLKKCWTREDGTTEKSRFGLLRARYILDYMEKHGAGQAPPAEELEAAGFAVVAYEDPSYTFDRNLVVYEYDAYANEAEALASYLGDDFVAIQNDGSFYLASDIVIRVAMQ